jgi:hypothetical protein
MMIRTRISSGLALVALAGALVFSCPNFANAQTSSTTSTISTTAKPKGAPGPIVGTGLSAAVVGFGIYWLIKRRRKVN